MIYINTLAAMAETAPIELSVGSFSEDESCSWTLVSRFRVLVGGGAGRVEFTGRCAGNVHVGGGFLFDSGRTV
jgi:hypothetical protein